MLVENGLYVTRIVKDLGYAGYGVDFAGGLFLSLVPKENGDFFSKFWHIDRFDNIPITTGLHSPLAVRR